MQNGMGMPTGAYDTADPDTESYDLPLYEINDVAIIVAVDTAVPCSPAGWAHFMPGVKGLQKLRVPD